MTIHEGLCFSDSANPVDHAECLLSTIFVMSEINGVPLFLMLSTAQALDRQQTRNEDDAMRSYR